MSSLLAGKIAVVTGASSGIGRAIAIGFAAKGRVSSLRISPSSPSRAGTRRSISLPEPAARRSFRRPTSGAGRRRRADRRHGRASRETRRHGEQRRTYSGTALLQTEPAQWEAGHAGQSDGHIQRLQARGPADDRPGAAAEVRGRLINWDPSKASLPRPVTCRTV